MIKAKLLERIFDLVAPLIWFYNQGWWDTKKLKIKYFNQMLNHSFIWREQSILNKTEEKLSQISKFGKFRFCLTAFTVHSSSFHVPAWISTSQGKQYSTNTDCIRQNGKVHQMNYPYREIYALWDSWDRKDKKCPKYIFKF